MKFSFKIQQYQTDAVDAVARVFQGQPYNAGVSYLRDMGSLSAQPQQLSLVSNGDDRLGTSKGQYLLGLLSWHPFCIRQG